MTICVFWLNAFIPRDVPGYTVTLPGGVHSGKTAIPRPHVARFHPWNMFTHLDVGFLSDQRGFSDAITASSRMRSVAEIDTASMSVMRQRHESSGTTQVDLVTGAQTGFAVADMSRCRFDVPPPPGAARGMPGGIFSAGRGGSTLPLPSIAAMRPTTGPATLVLPLTAAAGDPLVSAAADIDYSGRLTIERLAGGGFIVTFDGAIDQFPAYDCYASMNGTTKTIFTSSPPAGNTVVNLMNPLTLGYPSRAVRGTVSFP